MRGPAEGVAISQQITDDNYRERILEYYDDVAPEYGVRHGADMPGGQYSFGQLYKGILAPMFSPGMKVLELGCGNGASSEMLASFGVQLTATDISEEMIKVAEARGIPNTRFRTLDAMDLSGAADLGKFHAITAFNSFSYYPNKPKVLRDLKEILEPGGQLILLDMNAFCPVYPLSAWIGRLDMNWWWSTIRQMTPARLRALLEDAGYRVDLIRTLNFVPHATQGAVFEVLKALNPLLNALPGINRLAMRVLARGTLA